MRILKSIVHTVTVCLLVGCGAAAQTLSFSSPEVVLTAAEGATVPATHRITLFSTVPGATFTASVRHIGTSVPWLSISPASGPLPQAITLSASPAGLRRGTYAAQVVASSGIAGAFVNVSFTVGTGTGRFVVSPTGLTFHGSVGAPLPPAQTLRVLDRLGPDRVTTLIPSASSEGGWLSVSPFPVTTPTTVTVQALTPGLPRGRYTGSIKLTPTNDQEPTVVPVLLEVSGSAQVLSVTQTALTLNYQTGSATTPIQNVIVTSSIGGRYTASVSVPWIRLFSVFHPDPVATLVGTTPEEFRVIPVATGLAVGSYSGSILVTGPDLQTRTLPVTLNVTATQALNANPSSIVIDDITGLQTYTTVTATSGSLLAFSVRLNPPVSWLTVTPTSVSTGFGSQALTITASPESLPQGTHTTNIELVSVSAGTLTLPVRLIVGSETAEPAQIEVAQDVVALNGIVGEVDPAYVLDLRVNRAGATRPFTAAATSTGAWLSAEPFYGEAPMRLTIRANSAVAQKPGKHEGTVTITAPDTGQQVVIPVEFTLVARALVAQPPALSFTQQSRRDTPPAQTVQITSNVGASFTATPSATWVRVSPSSSRAPAVLTISVDPTGLPSGANTARIRIIGPDNEIDLPVTLTVPDPSVPAPAVESLSFTYELGSPPPSQTINVGSTDEPVAFNAVATTTSGGNWLLVTPASGMTPAVLSVAIEPRRLNPGQYTGTITVSVAGNPTRSRTVAVRLAVNPAVVTIVDVLHGAALTPGPIAPGEIVSIMGSGLGPLNGMEARPSAGGVFESRLNDVRVLFDGIPAPLLYVRTDQINAVVPYSMYGRTTARVHVEYNTSMSLSVDLRVTDAAPGLFTASGSGRGQAAALNSDFTPNSLANPAARGSIVMIYGTGEGQTVAPGQDGRVITTDIRHPLLPVTATVGGRPAEVIYFGSAPTLVSGIFQANVRIPEETETGSAPIEFTVGGAKTQAGVTISVR